MFEKLEQIEKNYEELTEQLSSQELMADMSAYAKASKQHRALGEIVGKYREVKKMKEDLAGARELVEIADDEDMRELAQFEITDLEERIPKAEEELKDDYYQLALENINKAEIYPVQRTLL
jgi:peptide chain release factor 1